MADHRRLAALDRRNRRAGSQPSCRARSRCMSKIEIVLASTSSSRRTMLEEAGVTFTVVAPNVDEELMKDMLKGGGAGGITIADAPGEGKALAGSKRQPSALVNRAEQGLVSGEGIFSKAMDQNETP